MKNAGMAGAVALVGIGLISIALSNVITAPQAYAGTTANQVSGQGAMIGIAIDQAQGSGRWNKTLLAVDSNGKVYALDTSSATTKWAPFKYSP